jgi:RNA polymerase sigma-70 factor (sigma-E family)
VRASAQWIRRPGRLIDEVHESRAIDAAPPPVEGVTAGAEPSFGRLEEAYVRNGPGALRLAYVLTGDRELAEDLMQEAFVRITGRLGHLRVPDRLDVYLRRTIVNLCTSQLRRRKLERAWLAGEAAKSMTQREDDPALRDEMWRALQRLPFRQRAALVLRFYEDLSERETAELLGCSQGALNSLVVRGIKTLRADLHGGER